MTRAYMTGVYGQHPAITCNRRVTVGTDIQLRCREPIGHADEHRWTPELVHAVEKPQ